MSLRQRPRIPQQQPAQQQSFDLFINLKIFLNMIVI